MMNKRDAFMEAAWKYLDKAVVCYKGKPVGTVAALDTGEVAIGNLLSIITEFIAADSLLETPDESKILFLKTRYKLRLVH